LLKCPIGGCKRRCKRYDTLFVHLMQYHGKNEVVKALLEMMAGRQLKVEKDHRFPDAKLTVTKVTA
jgi:hypothetical protein